MNNNTNENTEKKEQLALDDERRVKVLSPSMLVLKRFLRNKLAIVGFLIIVAMFLFSFAGPFFSPYGEYEVFKGYEMTVKNYASASTEEQLRFTAADGANLSSGARAAAVSAIKAGESQFTAGNNQYFVEAVSDSLYIVEQMSPVASYSILGSEFTAQNGFEMSDDFKNEVKAAILGNEASVDVDGVTYSIASAGAKTYTVSARSVSGVLGSYLYNGYTKDEVFSYQFRVAAETAMAENKSKFSFDGINYEITENNGSIVIAVIDGADKIPYVNLSKVIVQPDSSDIFLDAGFKSKVEEAITEKYDAFAYNGTEYKIEGVNGSYKIKSEVSTELIKIYEAPSAEHWLGTDANGMDILTRLMYGGRISLLIGFIVVLIEVGIGIVLGGVAGYFGGWIDNLIMRLVDIFNCIPAMPLFIILGSIMDAYKLDPQLRIYFLMIIMGVFGWPGIARLVRGQILSLREQEFMIATEATGISVKRRIFRHLIPNVIPQLIVMATMGLGSVILMESTLSFFGLGVKYPFASWGNIINAVTNVHVMTNYLFVWIPAGMLILLTVLGFNFVGDGLRDAFDPKMKR